ncbi:helix-turn-helix domain-containing protein [Laribacter hongkongensis]|uniref:helix-turn-helix domain-containing protein n=1 Tax=Laribacter hongkongensis TaxID=168471 RepID=UPI001EFE3815|nr:helix-turn-helix transcriptional regulator [Laribacter hongkongensis]MCG8998135.1 helix-turn-helix domain-containing protein [Laribacter hongkongensis]MCG9062739.1 helix-turn-helix domain-containing protein [Laribacter hongkongensis]MCG9064696.1 helix-turn-helix domain-containing protein [Laribacter hongkongensis]
MTPLKQARLRRAWRLHDVCNQINSDLASTHGQKLDTGNLSRIENGKQTPSKDLSERLAALYADDGLTEMHILFPHRFTLGVEKSVTHECEAVPMRKAG